MNLTCEVKQKVVIYVMFIILLTLTAVLGIVAHKKDVGLTDLTTVTYSEVNREVCVQACVTENNNFKELGILSTHCHIVYSEGCFLTEIGNPRIINFLKTTKRFGVTNTDYSKIKKIKEDNGFQ